MSFIESRSASGVSFFYYKVILTFLIKIDERYGIIFIYWLNKLTGSSLIFKNLNSMSFCLICSA